MGSQAPAWRLTDILVVSYEGAITAGRASIFGRDAEPLDMGSQARAWKLTDILVVSYEGAITAKA
jgi:hypothetical protein